jgi:probable rRNA maturation factor
MIFVDLNQSLLASWHRLSEEELARVMRAIAKYTKTRGKKIVSIAFVSAREMRRLNRVHRGKDKVTDVLSFEIKDGWLIGEVLVCFDQAKKQAREMKHSIKEEVVFLMVHGVLHLLGHDHEKGKENDKMFTVQSRILESLGTDPRV